MDSVIDRSLFSPEPFQTGDPIWLPFNVIYEYIIFIIKANIDWRTSDPSKGVRSFTYFTFFQVHL